MPTSACLALKAMRKIWQKLRDSYERVRLGCVKLGLINYDSEVFIQKLLNYWCVFSVVMMSSYHINAEQGLISPVGRGCVVMMSQQCSRPPSATVVSTEPFSHGTGTLRCLQKEMATYRHWSVSLWRDPDDVSHCRILSPDKTEWRLILATLCGWIRCFVADQLWSMTRIREEEEVERIRYGKLCMPVVSISVL